MNIGILTHHDVHNHGAHLQNYALIQVLKSFGHEAKSLTYTKNYDFLSDHADNKYNITLKSVPYYLKYMYKNGLPRTIFNVKKKTILSKFRRDNALVGGYYSKEKKLNCVVIGSDEVFSIEPGLNTFFWGMGVPSKYIFAYAGSFGPTTMEFIKEKNAQEFIEAGIKRIKKISVRDENSKNIIEQISGKTVPIVCDPVILYDFKVEMKNYEKPLSQEYLLIYAYDNNMNDKKEIDDIIAYAKSQKLLTISAGFYHKWCDKNVNVSPIELLKYIKGAKGVVTDTFHGSVISIVMNRPFVTKVRRNGNKIKYLLEEYGLSERAVLDFSNINSVFDEEIDYDLVNCIIDMNRRESMKYLQDCLECILYEK